MNPVTDSTHLRVDGPTGGSGAVSPPLVMVHGVGLDLHMWDLVVEALAVERQVVRYDLLGHGHSVDPPVGPSTRRWVLSVTGFTLRSTPSLPCRSSDCRCGGAAGHQSMPR